MIKAGVPVQVVTTDARLVAGLFFCRDEIARARVQELAEAFGAAVGGLS